MAFSPGMGLSFGHGEAVKTGLISSILTGPTADAGCGAIKFVVERSVAAEAKEVALEKKDRRLVSVCLLLLETEFI